MVDCVCDCGRGVSVVVSSLRTGNTKSCGCNQFVIPDEVGHKYGRLTVVARAANKGAQATWDCICECGKHVARVRGCSLRGGNTSSCGCLRRDRTRERISLPIGESGRNKAIAVMKHNARVRGLSWTIGDAEAHGLMAKTCHYCGAPPSNKARARNGDFVYSGIDRVDNLKGYEAGNVVACCNACNTAKMDMTLAEFRSWATRLASMVAGW